ncbi:hypothetical protein ACF07V_08490 [Streptomyces sp. NPDC015661]|uniref:hypothetical protein n=1 Tax=Streptomyces sp. NPDC015661 TaxID=3364961 RepID=UPI0037027865
MTPPRPVRPGRLRALLGTLCLALVPVVATVGTGLDPAAPPAYAATGESSAVTVSGTGDFAGLRITVGQTRNLVNQVIRISWTGGAPTVSDTAYAANYLQIMQCWGDENGPGTDQCQFGGSSALGAGAGNQSAGAYTNGRQLNYGPTLKDSENQPLPPPTPSGISYAPFRSVTGDEVSPGNWNEFFDVNSTNEIPYARTDARGAGEVYFEAQSGVEAPGLGCGAPVEQQGTVTGRGCWLVIVPRGTTEIDGTSYTTQSGGQLQSSPLSPANWKHRITVPLGFEPIGSYCPIGADERGTLGSEMAAEAITRWQPSLCRTGDGAIYGYAQVPDATARVKLLSGTPGMVFVGRAADRGDSGRTPVYAPVALSGITLAYSIESQAGFRAPDEVRQRNGTRMTTLRLTPRLVAKLLTESYPDGVSRFADSVAGNPVNLGRDPEFLRYNPEYADLDFGGKLGDALVPQPLADTTRQLWEWIAQDPAAAEFLKGTPDDRGAHGDPGNSGMKVNPHYKDATLPLDSFPKSDPYCQAFEDRPEHPLCIQDKHPYATDMHAAARAAGRGDTLARTSWDATATPPAYKKDPPQPAGQRAVLAVTDTATAERYGLMRAELLNGAGEFVAPDAASLTAAAKVRKPGADGVTVPDPGTRDPAAYPLTVLTYAATVPADLTAAEGRDYGTLLTYAAGAGQTPGVAAGNLPSGYAPLPEALREQTRGVARKVVADAGKTPTTGTPTPTATATTPAPTAVPTSTPPAGGGSGSVTVTGGSGSVTVTGGSGGAGAAGGSGGDSGGGSGGSDAAAGGSGAGSGGSATGSTGAAGGTGASRSPGPTPAHSPTAASPAPGAQTVTAVGAPTPAWTVGAVRNALLVCLILGALAAFAGPALPRYLPRLLAAARHRMGR